MVSLGKLGSDSDETMTEPFRHRNRRFSRRPLSRPVQPLRT
jgi:hypothetical protein